MSTERQNPSFVRIIDRLIGEPLSWITGKPRGRGRDEGSLIDHSLGAAVSWLGVDLQKKRGRY